MADNKLPEGFIRLNEQYLSGGAALDNFTMNNGMGRDNYGYRYNTRALTHDLEMQLPRTESSFMYITIGSRISSTNKNGDRVTGPIRIIKKDKDGYIIQVMILNDKTHRLIPVDIDDIKLLGVGMDKDYIDFVRESCDVNKAVAAEIIRENQNIDFMCNGKKYKAILENGMPTILTLNEGKVYDKRSILDVNNDNIIESIIKTKK